MFDQFNDPRRAALTDAMVALNNAAYAAAKAARKCDHVTDDQRAALKHLANQSDRILEEVL